MPSSWDPKAILSILGTIVISAFGIWLWIRRLKKNAADSEVRDREYLQSQNDMKRNKEANESYPEELQDALDEVPDVVDPADPWAGLR